ncbi:hypothetical protein HYW53_03090 [Candidatus Giovannonibacteria bacterium]|nr:hypothetical protein [Candidatus Giovannonibacteria bacterium]
MTKFSITCTCGDPLSVEAANREEAVIKMKNMMTQDAIDKHFEEKHPEEVPPDKNTLHAMIERDLDLAKEKLAG